MEAWSEVTVQIWYYNGGMGVRYSEHMVLEWGMGVTYAENMVLE